MDNILNIKVNWRKNIPFVLDTILEIGIGIFILTRDNLSSTLLLIGYFILTIGIVQLIRKIKTFQLSKTHLTIKRPLFPFKFAENEFEIQKIQLIEFKKVIRVGPYIKIIGKINGKDGGYMIAMNKQSIDLFENELKCLGLQVSRENI